MKTMTICAALLLPLLGGCDSAPATAATAVATAGPASESAEAPGETPRIFEQDEVRGDGCPLLSAAEVAELAGIDAGAISGSPVMDCFYEWASGSVVMMGVKVHDDIERASEYYEGVTGDYTAAEMQAAVDVVKEGIADEVAAGEADASAVPVGEALANTVPANSDGGAVSGVGDRAGRVNDWLYVLLGNVTFSVKAEHGNFDPALTQAVARRVVHNLEQL